MPEKSGMDAVLCVPLPAGPTAGATVCPKVGVANAAANATDKRNFCCRCMLKSLSWFVCEGHLRPALLKPPVGANADSNSGLP
jgi:hypothetical protein